jgi:hypothetical protein
MATTYAGSYTEYSRTSSYYTGTATAQVVQPTTAVAQPAPLPTVAPEPPPAPVVPQVPPPSMAGQTWGHIIPITAGYRSVPGRPVEWKVTRREDGHYNLDTLVSFGWRAEITAGLDVPSMNFALITANGVIIYNQDGLTDVAPGVTFTFYDGAQTTADPFWEDERGVGEVPAYIHHVLVNIAGLPLENFDDRRPEAWNLLVIDAPQALPFIRVENQDQTKIDAAVLNFQTTGYDYADPVISSDGYSFAWDPDNRYWYTLGQMEHYDDGAGNFTELPTEDNEYLGYHPDGGSDFVTFDYWNFGQMGGGKRILRHDLDADGAVTVINPNSDAWPIETSIYDQSGTLWRDPFTGDLWCNPFVSETAYPYFQWYCLREVNGFVNQNPPVQFYRATECAPLGATEDWIVLQPSSFALAGDDVFLNQVADFAWIERPAVNGDPIVIAQMVQDVEEVGAIPDDPGSFWQAAELDPVTGDVFVFMLHGPPLAADTNISLFRIPAPGRPGAGTWINETPWTGSEAWYTEPASPESGTFNDRTNPMIFYLGATRKLLLILRTYCGNAFHSSGSFHAYRHAYGLYDIEAETFEYKGWLLGPMTSDFTPCDITDPSWAYYARPSFDSVGGGELSWLHGWFQFPFHAISGGSHDQHRFDTSRAIDWYTFATWNVIEGVVQNIGSFAYPNVTRRFVEVDVETPTEIMRSFSFASIDPETTGLAAIAQDGVSANSDSIFDDENLTWVTHGIERLGDFRDLSNNWVEPPDGKPSDNPAQMDITQIDFDGYPYWFFGNTDFAFNNVLAIVNFAASPVEGISLRRWFTLLGELTTHLKGKVTVGSNILDPLDSMYLVDTQTTFNRDALAMCRATNCVMRENLDGVEIIRPVDGDEYTVDHELDEDNVIKRNGTGVTFTPVGEDDLPSKVVLHAIASEASFRWTERPARREQGPFPTTQSDKQESIRIQAGMPINQIQTYASDTLYRVIEAGDQAKLALAWTHAIKIQPGDIIDAPDNGSVHTLMVTKVNRDPNRMASIEAQRIHSADPPEGIADAGSSPDSPTAVTE